MTYAGRTRGDRLQAATEAAPQQRPHDDVNALLVRPDGTATTVVVDRRTGKGIADAIGCRHIRRWPYAYTLNAVMAGDRTYHYDVWVDEEACAADSREENLFASAAAHPLNEVTGHIIMGSAVLMSTSTSAAGRHLDMADWTRIRNATWCDDEAAETNADGPTALVRLDRRTRSL